MNNTTSGISNDVSASDSTQNDISLEPIETNESVQTSEPVETMEPAIDYTMTDTEKLIAKSVTGYKNKWFEKKENNVSLADCYNNLHVGKAHLNVLCWAFLAATDELRELCEKDDTRLPILVTLVRSNHIQAAQKIIKLHYQPITEQNHRVEIESFNPHTDVGRFEYSTSLSEATVWTLMKAFNAQLKAGVNRCYPRRVANRPLGVHQISHNTVTIKTKNGSVVKSNDKVKTTKEKESDANYRYPEEASWNSYSSSDLVIFLHDIQDVYNSILSSQPNLARAYRDASKMSYFAKENERLKRQAEKQAEYQRIQSERQAARQMSYEKRQNGRQNGRQNDRYNNDDRNNRNSYRQDNRNNDRKQQNYQQDNQPNRQPFRDYQQGYPRNNPSYQRKQYTPDNANTINTRVKMQPMTNY